MNSKKEQFIQPKLQGKRVKLILITPDKEEMTMESGFFSLTALNLPAFCGSISSGTGWRTSRVQEILQDDDKVCRFKTLNNIYEARAL